MLTEFVISDQSGTPQGTGLSDTVGTTDTEAACDVVSFTIERLFFFSVKYLLANYV